MHNATDADGRSGIAVVRAFTGISSQLIFDPRSYAFLGEREVVVAASFGLKPGEVLKSTAVLRIAIVDRSGLIP